MWLEDIDKNAKKARDKRIFDAWMACYSQEEIAEGEGLSQPQINEILSEMAKLPKSMKSYADYDLTLKGEDYDKEDMIETPLTSPHINEILYPSMTSVYVENVVQSYYLLYSISNILDTPSSYSL